MGITNSVDGRKISHSEITAVSNSKSQKEYIKGEAVRRGLSNVEVITTDINDFQPEQTFDRIVTVEMLSMFVITLKYSKESPSGLKTVGSYSYTYFATNQ